MKTLPRPLATAMALAVLAAPAAGIAGSPLQIETKVLVEQRLAARDGSTSLKLVTPSRVVPGDRVTLVLAYRNTGRTPLADVVLANPVPRGMTFRAAEGTAEVSVDGTRFAALGLLQVRGTDGQLHAARAADVTTVRWRLPTPIPAGAQGKLTFQAVLN